MTHSYYLFGLQIAFGRHTILRIPLATSSQDFRKVDFMVHCLSSFSFICSYTHTQILIFTEYPLCARILSIFIFSLGFYFSSSPSLMLSLWLQDLYSYCSSAHGALAPLFSQLASSSHSGLYKDITSPGKFYLG